MPLVQRRINSSVRSGRKQRTKLATLQRKMWDIRHRLAEVDSWNYDSMLKAYRKPSGMRVSGKQRDALVRSLQHKLTSLETQFDREAKRDLPDPFSNPARSAAQYRLAEAVLHGTARTKTSMTKKAAQEIIRKTPAKLRSEFMKENAGPKSRRKFKKAARKRLGLHKRRKNPEASAIAAYQDTHGKLPQHDTVVETKLNYHKNLAGMGRLVELEICPTSGGLVLLKGFGKNCILALNESQTQLFIVGGDQSVDLRSFGIKDTHEKEVLGTCKSVTYYTEKLHLIDKDGGKGFYQHKFESPRPFIVYDSRNKLLSFAGGGYSIPAEGIKG